MRELSNGRAMMNETADRRTVLIGGAAAALLAGWLAGARGALAQDKVPTWEETIKKIVGDAKPTEAKLVVDMPEIAENGNTVPFTITVDSPMTDADYVKAVHVVSTGNPVADVATFRFTPLSGRAVVSSRLRLAKTQDVMAVAELSTGGFLVGRRTVKVTIGGCGG